MSFALDPDSPSWALHNDTGVRVLAAYDGRHTAAKIAAADGPALGGLNYA